MNLPLRFDHTFRVEVIIAIVVFGLILLALLFAIVRSFTKSGRRPWPRHEFTKAEVSYTAVLAVVTAGLVTFSLTENTSTVVAPKVTVNVTGFQWCWRFAYPGTGVSVTADCVDGRLPTMVVPTGEVIRFNVTSADVIHAFWVPHLRFKTFAYPHFTNTFETTVAEPGNWLGECSEFCGLYHYAMHFRVKAVPPASFQTWLHHLEARSP
ncbi:MAG: cytochrome c oxidase subunit II [Sciscionella sp.]